jgi:group II intron reverse transcriptase/maturase
MKRNPEGVLKALSEHSKDSNYKFERLYRNLFNEQMFYVAYQRIYANQGNMTPGTDGKTIDQMSLQRIDSVIESLRDETYQPHPARRVYIPKKNGKKRPLGIPSFEDKLVQEVVRMLLETIYEGYFEWTSHGFRPNRSCHTALAQIQKTFSGAKWFIEGDIKGFFDNIDHNVLIDILHKRIADERFLRLIRKFLNAGYIEDWKYNRTYSGTPQGGIISPILANIYLDQFDKYMKAYAQKFDEGKERRRNNEYYRLNTRRVLLNKKIKSITDEEEKSALIRKSKEIQKVMLSIPVKDAMAPDYRRIQYVRYADDFLVSVIAGKAECEKIKTDIGEFMRGTLHLELSKEKTLITNSQDKAKFLGYEVSVRKSNVTKRDKNGKLCRAFNGSVVLTVNPETIRKKLSNYGALKIGSNKGKDCYRSKSREYMIGMKPEDILAQYNGEIRGFYNYFALASNASAQCSTFGYIMEWSLYKTLGQKLNLSSMQVKAKYRKDKDFVIPYKDKDGKEKYRILYNGGFKKKSAQWNANYDAIPQRIAVPYPSLAERLMSGVCELCGKEGSVVMHHVRNLNLLKGDKSWEALMLKRHRKTLVVCKDCNELIQQNGH